MMKKIAQILCLSTVGLIPFMASANAASSAWFKVPGGKIRLVTAANPDNLEIDAALEIKLEKGWKTYWRSPGDSGIPPQLSFVGSKNINTARFDFPTPSYFQDLGVKSVGYKKHVAFPISIRMIEQSKPTVIKLSLVVGICSEICVPVQASLSLTEPGTIGPSFEVSRVINDAKNSLPTAPKPDFRVTSASWNPKKPNEIAISSIVPKGSMSVDMHVEGPQDWYLLPAVASAGDSVDGKLDFVLDIGDIPPGADPSSTELRFTLVADGRSVEQLLVPVQ